MTPLKKSARRILGKYLTNVITSGPITCSINISLWFGTSSAIWNRPATDPTEQINSSVYTQPRVQDEWNTVPRAGVHVFYTQIHNAKECTNTSLAGGGPQRSILTPRLNWHSWAVSTQVLKPWREHQLTHTEPGSRQHMGAASYSGLRKAQPGIPAWGECWKMKENSPEIFDLSHLTYLWASFSLNTSFAMCLGTSGIESLQLPLIWNLLMKNFRYWSKFLDQTHLKLALKGLFPRKHKACEREIKRANWAKLTGNFNLCFEQVLLLTPAVPQGI